MLKGFSLPLILLLITITVAFLVGLNFSKSSLPDLPTTQKQTILTEKIKGSRFHSPDATWWGYNQSKIVRFKNLVFTYYIDNDDDKNTTTSRFVIMKKNGDKDWEEGAIFPTSRPGNILIDSKGVLHAFVFEPYDVVKNDSWGKILHYWFPEASSKGDITNFKQETVVDNDGKSETANIRVGAAIGADDTLAVSFGLTKFNPAYKEQSEHIYYKKPNEEKWNHTFTDNLPHDYYYPFALVSDRSFYLLPVQDDFNDDGNPATYDNIYQKILFMQVTDGKWQSELIADLSSHPLARERPRLLEQEDLFKSKDGNIHIIYKEFLDPDNINAATSHWHVSGKLGNWKKEQIPLVIPGVNWIRLVEVETKLYYLITTFGQVFISPVENIQLTKINIPEDAKSFYPYVATSKSGTKESEYVDVLLLGADQKLFSEGKNTDYYLRIPKSYFNDLK